MADMELGTAIPSQPDIDTDSDGASSSSTEKTIDANNLSRCIEVGRFTGAPAQGFYYFHELSRSNDNLEVTSSIQIGNVIGSGVGLVGGVILWALSTAYRNKRNTTGCKIYFCKSGQMPDKIDKGKMYVEVVGDTLVYKVIDGKGEVVTDKIAKADLGCNFDKPLKIDNLKSKILKITSRRGHTRASSIFPVRGTSTNPFYRNFKVLANFGWQLGTALCNFIGVQDPFKRKMISCILSDLCAFVLGLFAFPYWLIREKILKIDPKKKHKYGLTGIEGWSKYTRTALAFGTSVGQAIGGLYATIISNSSAAMASLTIAVWGGIVGVVSFIAGLTLVPLINWISSKGYRFFTVAEDFDEAEIKSGKKNFPRKSIILRQYNPGEGKPIQIKAYLIKNGKVERPVDLHLTPAQIASLNFPAKGQKPLELDRYKNRSLVKDVRGQLCLGALASEFTNRYRNNYTRSGMALGLGIGACLGLLIGAFSPFGMVLGAVILSSIGSVIGGVVFSFISSKLWRMMHPIPKGFNLYLMGEDEEIIPRNLPNRGKRTIVLRKGKNKNGQAVVEACWIRDGKVGQPAPLRLTLKELQDVNQRFEKLKRKKSPDAYDPDRFITSKESPKLVKAVYELSEDVENGFDYITRCTALIFSFIGAALACIVNPAAALLLAPLGAAIAGAVGWGFGIGVNMVARKISPEEGRAKSMPWTMRMTMGANVGAFIGGVIGIAVGLAGFIFTGGASLIFGVTVFTAIGAFIGGLIGGLWEKKARSLTAQGIKAVFTGFPQDKELSIERPKPPLPRRNSEPLPGQGDKTRENKPSTGSIFASLPPAKRPHRNSMPPITPSAKDASPGKLKTNFFPALRNGKLVEDRPELRRPHSLPIRRMLAT